MYDPEFKVLCGVKRRSRANGTGLVLANIKRYRSLDSIRRDHEIVPHKCLYIIAAILRRLGQSDDEITSILSIAF